MANCEALNWRVDITGSKVVAAMSFADFDQSMRFVELVVGFILAERKPPQILEDIAWYYPPTDTGSVT